MIEPTEGEKLLKRQLATEKRAGVEHYVPGQHEAEIQDGGDVRVAWIGYVDVMGHAVLLSAVERGGVWLPKTVQRAGQAYLSEAETPPEGFVLSEKMLAAIAAAEEGS